MNEDDELDFALRDARDRGDTERILKLEKQRAERAKEKEKLKLDVLKNQVQNEKTQKPNEKIMVTMTGAEEAKADVLTAQGQPNIEQQIKSAALKVKAKEDSEEYQQDLG